MQKTKKKYLKPNELIIGEVEIEGEDLEPNELSLVQQYFFGKKNNFFKIYDIKDIDKRLCEDKLKFPIHTPLADNEFFAGIIVDNKIQLIVRYELDTIKANKKDNYDIALNYLYQKNLIISYIKKELDEFNFDIKYIKINYICATKGFGTKFLNTMENYYLPDIIVVSNPLVNALKFYYKNNFKTNFMTKSRAEPNCTLGQLIFKVPSYSTNIYSKINNKLIINSINDLKKENIKKLFIDNNYQHLLFSDGIIDEDKMNFLIDELLDEKNINNKDINGDTILNVLLQNKMPFKYLKTIIDKFKINDDVLKSVIKTFFVESSFSKKYILDNLKWILENNLEKYFIELKSEVGNTILIIAIIEDYTTDIVKLLLDRGAKIDEKNNKGQTAMMFASLKGFKEIVKLLLDYGANVDEKNNEGYTAMMFASLKGFKEVVKLLLDYGAEVDEKNNKGFNAILCALFNKHTDIVKLLYEKKTNSVDIKRKFLESQFLSNKKSKTLDGSNKSTRNKSLRKKK